MNNDIRMTLFGNILSAAAKYRIVATRIFAGMLILLLLLTDSRWAAYPLMDSAFEILGLILVTLGAFGRLWASLYISGYKVNHLITEGPYSVVRNPLYFFSFLGAGGLALAARSFLVVTLVVIAFLLYYPLVVAREEKKLADRHGAEYAQYAGRTPRFMPNLTLYHEPQTYLVNVRKHQQAFLDAMFFIWIYGILQVIQTSHDTGLLPVLFKIP